MWVKKNYKVHWVCHYKMVLTAEFESQKQTNHHRGYSDKVWKCLFIEAMKCFSFEVEKMVYSGLLQFSNPRLWIDREKWPAYTARVPMRFCVCLLELEKDWDVQGKHLSLLNKINTYFYCCQFLTDYKKWLKEKPMHL